MKSGKRAVKKSARQIGMSESGLAKIASGIDQYM